MPTSQPELTIRSARDPRGEALDLHIADGRILEAGPALDPVDGAEVIDASGCVVLPALVDGHAHIDKTLWGQAWHSHRAGPRVADRIANEREVLDAMSHDVQAQSARLLRHMLSRGSTAVRTHVDIGPDPGLRHFDAVSAVRETHRRWMDMQIVAFPQTGVMCAPGTLDLLDQAVAQGAEVLGGIDPVGIDRDPRGQLDGLFAIADARGCELDIHLHDRGELGAITIEMIAERVRALGLGGRVVVSHAFCLGSVPRDRLEGLLDLLAELDIAIMSHGPSGGTPTPPLRLLHERGVRLFSGSDGVRDTWGPLNTGDMLERAFLVAYVNGFRDDAGLHLALGMATHAGAQVLGLSGYGLEPGCNADLVLVEARNGAEAVVAHGPRRLVLRRGSVVAREGVCTLP